MNDRVWFVPLSRFSDASQARQLREEALAAMREDAEIRLDWSNAGHVHASALQILLALRAEAPTLCKTWKADAAFETNRDTALTGRLLVLA